MFSISLPSPLTSLTSFPYAHIGQILHSNMDDPYPAGWKQSSSGISTSVIPRYGHDTWNNSPYSDTPSAFQLFKKRAGHGTDPILASHTKYILIFSVLLFPGSPGCFSCPHLPTYLLLNFRPCFNTMSFLSGHDIESPGTPQRNRSEIRIQNQPKPPATPPSSGL